MARLNKIAISLCALLFTSISFTPLAQASGHTHASASPKALPAKSGSERKKKQPVKKLKPPLKPPVKVLAHQAPYPHYRSKPNRTSSSGRRRDEKCVLRKGYKKQCAKTVAASAEPTLALNSVKSKCVVRKGYKNAVSPRPAKRI